MILSLGFCFDVTFGGFVSAYTMTAYGCTFRSDTYLATFMTRVIITISRVGPASFGSGLRLM